MYYVNLTGNQLRFQSGARHYLVNVWEHVDLPDQLYQFISDNHPLLEVDYPRYIAEMESQPEREVTYVIHYSTSGTD